MNSRNWRLWYRAAAVAFMLVVGVAPSSAQSESGIRGQVLAAADGSTVAGAVVVLQSARSEESIETRTDGAGWFAFQGLRPGRYVLLVSHEGFSPRELPLALEPREIRSISLGLDVRGLDVQVTVSAPEVVASTHSPSSTLLTADRLDSVPSTLRLNLSDAIAAAAPGMIRGHDDLVHVRGHEVALNALIEGVSFWENPHVAFSGGLSPDVIETANVMTGGFPAEYGNRFGGVVDIVTKSGFSMQHDGSVTLSAGGAGRRTVASDFGGHRDRVGYYLFGTFFTSGRFLSPPDPRAIHDRARGGHLFAQFDGSLGSAGSLRTALMVDGTNFQVPKTSLDEELRPSANAAQRTRQQSAIVRWTKAWSSDLSLAASFYQRWSGVTLDPAAGPLTARAAFDRKLLTVGGKIDMTRFVGRHAIKAGFDGVRLRPHEDLAYHYGGYRDLTRLLGLPHIDVIGDEIVFSGRDSGGQLSAYVQDGLSLGDRLTANVGVRLDRYGLVVDAARLSPRVNLAYRLDAGTVVYASYNHFFVPPPIEGVLSSSAGLTARIHEIDVALPRLEPAVEDQFELGAAASVGPAQLGITGYYRATDNPVHTTVWPDSRIYSYASFDRARASGLEMKADLSGLARYGVTGFLNYALGRVDYYNPVAGGFLIEAEHLTSTDRFLAPMDQTHTVTGGVTYRHTVSGVWLGTSLEYGSGTPVGHGGSRTHEPDEGDADHGGSGGEGGRVAGHVIVSLLAGVDVLRDARGRPRFALRLDVENVTNNVYRIAQENEFSPGQFAIPRLLSLTAKIRF